MKRILIIAVLCLSALTAAQAQTIEILAGKQQKVFMEKTSFTANSVTFGYLEATYGGGSMLKVFREQKFWDTPLYIHAEYQATFDGGHTLIGGLAYSFNTQHGSITLCPLYRYDGGHAGQLSEVNFFDWGWCELYCYNHFWYGGAPCFFGEERFHVKVGDHLKVGAVVDLTYFGAFAATPFFGLRYDF